MKSYVKIILVLGIVAGCGLIGFETLLAQSGAVDELKNKINSHSSTIKQLEEEISKYKKELTKTAAEAQTLQTVVSSLDINAKKLGSDIRVTETKIDRTSLTIEQLAFEIQRKERQIGQNQKALADAIRNLNQNDSQSMIETMLVYPNMSTFWNEIETIQQFQTKVRDNLDILRQLKNELEGNKKSTEIQKEELVGLKSQLSDQKTVVEVNKNEKAKLLTETKNQESNYKKIIADREAKKKAFEKELAQFESDLRIAIDPKSIPGARSGILAWPVDDPVLTQNFGYTTFALANAALYNGNGHNGIDLKASIGTPIKAALDGVVEGTGNTDTVCPGASYGKWVFIRHPNGLATLYAHLSVISVSANEQVSTGHIIGYSGNTGYATGPHLHFTVYASQGVKILSRKSVACGGTYTMPIADPKAYLDPESYL